MSYYKIIEVEKICRTCLTQGNNMRSLFSIQELIIGVTMTLSEMLICCASVQVTQNDCLPGQICQQCVHNITRLFSFRLLCESSENTLRNLLNRPIEATFSKPKPLLETDIIEITSLLPDPLPSETDALIKLTTESDKRVNDNLAIITDKLDINEYEEKIDIKYNEIKDEMLQNETEGDICEDAELKVEVEHGPKLEKEALEETDHFIYPCAKCSSRFATEADLKDHSKTHSKVSHHHICKTCNKIFASASSLCRHETVHTGDKPFLCSKCGKVFSRSYNYKRHLSASCTFSDKSFTQPFKALEHVAHEDGGRQHGCPALQTGLGDNDCECCSKDLTTSSNLIAHKNSHTGSSYICNTCGKSGFWDSSKWAAHSRTHSGKEALVCNTCGLTLSTSRRLQRHMRRHVGEKPHKCTLCPRAFSRKDEFRIHLKKHIGERDYVCSFCKKGFYEASKLKLHLRVHTKEKRFICNICNKAFSQNGSLSTHMMTHK